MNDWVVERRGILEFTHFRYALRFISQVCVSGLSNLFSWQRPAAIFMNRLAVRTYENKSCVSNLLNYNEIFTIYKYDRGPPNANWRAASWITVVYIFKVKH